MDTKQTSCKQCGICCTKGGPAFHGEDIELLREGLIPRRNLVTLRKGEFAFNPVAGQVEATKNEIIKIKGRGREWTCYYYDAGSRGCTIYNKRPMACGVLQCWNPEATLLIAGKDLLTRFDIVEEVPLIELIEEYEDTIPMIDCEGLTGAIATDKTGTIASLEETVNRDLQFRNEAVLHSTMVLKEEMFLFGRPLFQILQPFGLVASQHGDRLRLTVNV